MRNEDNHVIDIVILDADDTLWHDLPTFFRAQTVLEELVQKYDHDHEKMLTRLYEIEEEHIQQYGYGVKSFTLSMIATAIDATRSAISADDIKTLIGIGKHMLEQPIELLEGTLTTLEYLKNQYSLLLITKGDLMDQRRKLAQSGVSHFFDHVEVVPEKNDEVYQRILTSWGFLPANTLTIGNSLKSDIIPILNLGGFGIHVPYKNTWWHETTQPPDDNHRFIAVEKIEHVPEALHALKTRYASHHDH